jgi:decaprenylphospho-beta-D-erythro-pentofuranosid-2-ulose 2-reductase
VAHILIIGATSAVATACAEQYAARGDSLYLLARNREKLDHVSDRLGDVVVGCDYGDFNESEANPGRIERAFSALRHIDIALVAHGDLGDQLASEHGYDEALAQIKTNFTSVISLLIPLVNQMEKQGHGHIAVMSSVAAERGRPRNYTYASAKAGLNTYLQGVRSRLFRSGVQVHVLKLGPVDTPMTASHEKDGTFSTPEVVATGIVKAIERGKSEAYIPGRWALIMTVVRNLPEWIFQKIPSLSGR